MYAIVTGSTGMLGVALIKLLLEEGFNVVAVARPGSKRINNIPEDDRVSVVELELEDMGLLPGVLSSIGVTNAKYFFHLAWDGTFGNSRNDMDCQTANIKASLDAVAAAGSLGCEGFMGAGSQAEYGRVMDGTKLSDKTPTNPENGYGIAKLCAGQMTRIKCEELGMKHVWVRILSTYGMLDGAHTMVMSIIKACQEGRRASCTKGEQMWDYLYAKDAARAFYLALSKGKSGSIYPIGSGNVMPLKDYIVAIRDACSKVYGKEMPEIGFGDVDYYPGQVMYLCADIDNLTKDTGFVPQYSFEEGILELVTELKALEDA